MLSQLSRAGCSHFIVLLSENTEKLRFYQGQHNWALPQLPGMKTKASARQQIRTGDADQ